MEDFSIILENWYADNGRYDLPWRKVSDPYLIWISETILQQTRIAQGTDYYLRFVERFPDVGALAAAEEDEVLKLWQGLGYYSRARNLHFAARTVAAQGGFPTDYGGVRALKGVGDYTAAAICSFAYRQPYAVVDGNVYRVLSRIFGVETPIDSTAGKKEFAGLADALLDRKRPHIYNSAIMDFGALQCTPKSPQCEDCPFAGRCFAYGKGCVEQLPVKAKKTAVTNRYFVYLYVTDGEELLLHRREKGDIWQGLYEPYLMEFPTPPSDGEVLAAIQRTFPMGKNTKVVARGLKHVLTHRRLWVDCYHVSVGALPDIPGYIHVRTADRGIYATPKIVTTLFERTDDEETGLFGQTSRRQ